MLLPFKERYTMTAEDTLYHQDEGVDYFVASATKLGVDIDEHLYLYHLPASSVLRGYVDAFNWQISAHDCLRDCEVLRRVAGGTYVHSPDHDNQDRVLSNAMDFALKGYCDGSLASSWTALHMIPVLEHYFLAALWETDGEIEDSTTKYMTYLFSDYYEEPHNAIIIGLKEELDEWLSVIRKIRARISE